MSVMMITCFISVEGEMCKTVTLFGSFWGETLYLSLAEKLGFWVFENRLLTTVYRIERESFRTGCSRLYTELRERVTGRQRKLYKNGLTLASCLL